MPETPDIVITSALPYANGPIHLGHLVEYTQTDIYVRFLKLIGKRAIYCCAGDTHGTPIEMNAKKQNIDPTTFVEQFNKEHQEDFKEYHINFDSYYSTNAEENRLLAEKIYKKLQEQEKIYEKELELTYCETDKRFLPDRYVKGTCPKCKAPDQYGDVCEKCNATYETTDLLDPYCTICKSKPTRRKSTHLFFKLSESSDFLKEWLNKNRRLQPEIRNQVLNWVNEGLQDWCISRDGPYFGFKIPDSDKYFYVWLDAPIGYISSLAHYFDNDIEKAEEVWNSADVQHFIGKDIIYFHLLFWPAVLNAAGWKVPDNLVVHGFLTVDGEKMSKSRGTFLTAKEFQEKVPETEFLRFYYAGNLGHSMTDVDLNLEDFTSRVNNELVSNIANFVYRTLSFITKNYEGKLSTIPADERAAKIKEETAALVKRIKENYAAYEFRKVVQDILKYGQLGNQYFQEAAPWEKPGESQEVLTLCANLVSDLSILLAPILPQFSRRVQQQLHVDNLSFHDIEKRVENHTIGTPEIIWKKIEPVQIEIKGEASPALLDLRVAKIIAVEKHPKADKLYIEKLDDGSGQERTIVSGLVGHYTPEELTGKNIILVNNLLPAKLRGVESQGMLLAAEEKKSVKVLEVPEGKPGDPVLIENFEQNKEKITIDQFFSVKITVQDSKVRCNGAPLLHNKKQITSELQKGKVA